MLLQDSLKSLEGVGGILTFQWRGKLELFDYDESDLVIPGLLSPPYEVPIHRARFSSMGHASDYRQSHVLFRNSAAKAEFSVIVLVILHRWC